MFNLFKPISLKELDVVKLNDGRCGTILDMKDDLLLLELDNNEFEIITVNKKDIEKIIWQHKLP